MSRKPKTTEAQSESTEAEAPRSEVTVALDAVAETLANVEHASRQHVKSMAIDALEKLKTARTIIGA